jgi:hypothetical protein
MSAVRADGSIAYGEGDHLAWVDNHHTGFVVEALREIEAHARSAGVSLPVDEMSGFYKNNLFEDDGRPLPAVGRRWPIDVIAGAQGIQTFARHPGDVACAQRIARFMIGRMRLSDGSFRYQRGRAHSKNVRYARWSDAPMCLAFATLSTAMREKLAATAEDERHLSLPGGSR